MKLKVPAKINLMLRVTGLKENGYHLLQMVNAKSFNVFDEIEILESSNNINKIHYSLDHLNNLEKDITIELLKKIYDIYNIKKYYDIKVIKHIPEGAGLGGSSVDAAAILKYVLCDNHVIYKEEELYNLCSLYGADIPYCLNDDICICEGIGEKVEHLNINFNVPHVIVVPEIFSSTKEVYRATSNNTIPLDKDKIKDYISNNKYINLLYNDLYNAAIKINPKLKEVYNDLSKYGDVIMSGSGSSFIIFNFRGNILNLKKKYNKVFTN